MHLRLKKYSYYNGIPPANSTCIVVTNPQEQTSSWATNSPATFTKSAPQ
jgi:hypothetical protein